MKPEGLGVWIWQLSHCEGGDFQKIVDRCNQCGISWLAVKAGDGSSNGQITRSLTDAMHAGGVNVYSWNYSTPQHAASELAYIPGLYELGIDGHILDAEIEWESVLNEQKRIVPYNWKPQAKDFAQKLRAAIGPKAFLADAPWPMVKSHPGFPWDEFGDVVNMRMDQLYWCMQPSRTFTQWAARSDLEWSGRDRAVPRCPIGSAWDATREGGQASTVTAISEYLERYKDKACQSLWSWQHFSPALWTMLQARQNSPAPPAEPSNPQGCVLPGS